MQMRMSAMTSGRNTTISMYRKRNNREISDYARALYIRTHWSTFNPAEGVYGWDTNEKLKK